jgi:hypothetical protein
LLQLEYQTVYFQIFPSRNCNTWHNKFSCDTWYNKFSAPINNIRSANRETTNNRSIPKLGSFTKYTHLKSNIKIGLHVKLKNGKQLL